MIHANQATKCKQIIVSDLLNYTINEYNSLTEASNILKINRKIIEKVIKRNGIYKNKYQFALKNN